MIELHIISDLRHGGAQTQLCATVRDAEERGDQVHVASLSSSLYGKPKGIADTLIGLGAKVHPIGQRFAVDPFATLRLKRLLYAIDPECVKTWDAASGKLLRAAGRPSEAEWTHLIRQVDPSAQVAREDLLLARHADLVIAAADSIAKQVHQRCKTEYRVELNQLFRTGWIGDKQTAREELGLPSEAKLAVMVGRLDNAGYLKEAIWNADLVRILHEDFQLLIVGDGPCQQAGERFAAGASEPGVIQFVGNQPEVSPWLMAADVVWCPIPSAGISTPMVEAMHFAKPMVATKASGRGAIITTGEHGYLAQWNDRAAWAKATDQLLSDSAHAEQVGEAGKSLLVSLYEQGLASEQAAV